MFLLALGAIFFLGLSGLQWWTMRGVEAETAWDRAAPARLVLLMAVGVGLAAPAVHNAWMEHELTKVVRRLATLPRTDVTCHWYRDPGSGAAYLDDRDIHLGYETCRWLMSYRRHPSKATRAELWSLNALTHEAMHLAFDDGNETRTNCRAAQRNARTARMLGVDDDAALIASRRYYREIYREELRLGHTPIYFSGECAAGLSLDEHLPDPPW